MTALGLGLGLPFGGRISNPLYSLGATFAIDARDASSTSQWVLNRGTGDRALDAQLGSVGRAEVINGVGLRLPGVSGNYASIPHNANLVGSTELEIIFLGAITNSIVGSNHALISKWANSSATNCWRIDSLDANRFIIFYHDGTTGRNINFAYGTRPTDTRWWRFVFQCNSGGNARIDVYNQPASSTVPTSWGTATGATGTACVSLNPADTSAVLVGITDNTFLAHEGSFSRVIVRTTIGGSNIVDIDFAAQPSLTSSFTATSGQTVTVTAVSGVDTNDPLLLTHTGTNYLYLPGTQNNWASSPDAAAVDILSNIQIAAHIALDDWTPSLVNTIVGKRSGGPTNFGYHFKVSTSGNLVFEYGDTAVSTATRTSTATISASNEQALWVKVTRDAASGAVEFFTAPTQLTEPTTWTQLGATVAGAIGSMANSGDPIGIGAYNGSFNEQLTGRIYKVVVRNGIGGTIVFDADFSRNTSQTSFTESSSNAATVTINRSSGGRKSAFVVRPVWLLATDDYLTVRTNDAINFANPDSFTVIYIHRQWDTQINFGGYLWKETGSVGYQMAAWTTTRSVLVQIRDSIGSVQTPSGAPLGNQGTVTVFGLVRNVVADTLVNVVNNSTGTPQTDTTTGTIANNASLVIGRAGGGYSDVEILAVAIFRKALTAGEIAQIVSYYGAA